jgi:hypothetical protein
MSEETSTKRDRKATIFLAPEKESFASKGFSYEAGSGEELGSIDFFRHQTDTMASDAEILVLLHTFLFGSAGKATMRKKQIRSFSGFVDADKTNRALRVTKNKNWNVANLKIALGLVGAEKSGSRDELIERLVDYFVSPSTLRSAKKEGKAKATKRKASSEEGQTKTKAKKTKTKGDSDKDKPKRAPSAFLLFSSAKRAAVKKQNPEFSFGEVGKELGRMWREDIAETEKEIWKAAAAAAGGAADDEVKQEEQKEEEEEEE